MTTTNKLSVKNFRLQPADSDFLDRKIGFKGEIYFDNTDNTIRFFNGSTQGGYTVAKNDLSNVSNADFSAKASAAGVGGGGGGGNNFGTIAVAGQSNVVADAANDILTLVAGSGLVITTNASTDTVTFTSGNNFNRLSVTGQDTITASTPQDNLNFVAGTNITLTTDAATNSITINSVGAGGASNSFSTISIAGQTNVVADSTTDTLTLVAGTGITLTTNAGTDTITISSVAGVTTFDTLTDASTAGLTVDEVYLPAITALSVTNSGASAYLFDQYSGNNPTVYAIGGLTIAFKLNTPGHPFLIQDGTGTNYNTGLVHVSTTGTVTTGASAQGQTSGTLYWKVPSSISGNYRYQCSIHAPMVGVITVKNIVSL